MASWISGLNLTSTHVFCLFLLVTKNSEFKWTKMRCKTVNKENRDRERVMIREKNERRHQLPFFPAQKQEKHRGHRKCTRCLLPANKTAKVSASVCVFVCMKRWGVDGMEVAVVVVVGSSPAGTKAGRLLNSN